MTFGVITALSNAVEARDSHTGGHGHRLVELALALARELGCSEQECEDICWAAVLHDIGKIGVPDGILSKPGSLTEEEWELMRRHPELGYQILSPISALKNAARYVRHHHERYDGRGYPDGLKGEEIPLGARIIAVADAYVAMTEDRIYRKGRSHQEALAELKRCSGTQFDPKVVEAFVRLFSDQRAAFA
jgi:HD-GYP domain-containing protein (c-di-GMP phosphodiesterase class II)